MTQFKWWLKWRWKVDTWLNSQENTLLIKPLFSGPKVNVFTVIVMLMCAGYVSDFIMSLGDYLYDMPFEVFAAHQLPMVVLLLLAKIFGKIRWHFVIQVCATLTIMATLLYWGIHSQLLALLNGLFFYGHLMGVRYLVFLLGILTVIRSPKTIKWAQGMLLYQWSVVFVLVLIMGKPTFDDNGVVVLVSLVSGGGLAVIVNVIINKLLAKLTTGR